MSQCVLNKQNSRCTVAKVSPQTERGVLAVAGAHARGDVSRDMSYQTPDNRFRATSVRYTDDASNICRKQCVSSDLTTQVGFTCDMPRTRDLS